MSASLGAFITCFLTSLVLTGYIFVIIYVKKNILYEGMRFTFAVIILILIRMLIPVNFPFTITIPISGIFASASRSLYYHINDGSIRVVDILVGIWAVVAVVKLICMFLKNWECRLLLEPFRVKDLSEYPVIKGVIDEYGVAEKMAVCILPASVSPEMFGTWKPILILPEQILTEHELTFICRHELEHYKNHDLWLKFFLDLVICVQWFNPLVYLLQNELILAFEMVNDHKVLKGCDEKQKITYVLSIIKIAKALKKRPAKQEGVLFTKANEIGVKKRVHFITAEGNEKKKQQGVSVFLRYISVVVMFSVSLTFVLEADGVDEIVEQETNSISKENAYILKCEEGYQLFVDGNYMFSFPIIPEEFVDLDILEKEI